MTNYYPCVGKTKCTEENCCLGGLLRVCGRGIISFVAHMPHINLKQEEYCTGDHLLREETYALVLKLREGEALQSYIIAACMKSTIINGWKLQSGQITSSVHFNTYLYFLLLAFAR